MVKVDIEALKKILIEELDYSEHNADFVLENFPREIPGRLGEIWENWLKDRTVVEGPIFEDLTIQEVMKNRGCNFIVAVKYLFPLFDPEKKDEEKQSLVGFYKKPRVIE